jgi:DNA replication protein DnaC
MLEITHAKAGSSYPKSLKQLAKYQLLIVDDREPKRLKSAQHNDLVKIMDDRHSYNATLVISQLPIDQWYVSIGDITLASIILDRLMRNAHRLQFKGEFIRKEVSITRNIIHTIRH